MELKINKKIIIYMLLVIITMITGTYAWLNYRSSGLALVLTIGDVNGMIVTVKPYKLTGSLELTDDYLTDGKEIDVTVTNNHPNKQLFNLYFDINTIDSALNTAPTSQYFKYIVLKSTTGAANSYTTTVANDDFTGANTNDDFVIYSESVNTNTTYYYKVYIYLEEDTNADQSALQNAVFNAEFRASIESAEYTDPSGANPPELTSGMVPVKLNGNGTVVTTVDPVVSDEWYDYSQSKWANAVLVDSSVRGNYINSSTGEIIPDVTVDTTKILAYYVWIPRYKYTFANNSTTNPYPVQAIDIQFEAKTAARANGRANGPNDYYTHPAFTWNFSGNTLNESSPNLGGIWVGKFELSHKTLTTSSMSCTSISCGANANNIRILPNKTSLRSNTVSSFFYGIRSMQQSGNSFGLPTATTIADSHMMKNREWGAVAYLAHSPYGLGNKEVRINSYTSIMTGCGASKLDKSNEETCYDPYGKTTTASPSTTRDTTTYPQSTTGNITGVFDMSGGSYDYVMGNYNGTNSSAGFSSLPALKYYDKYTVTSNSSCTFAECGGHDLKETASWHGDNASFVGSSSSWFIRGGDRRLDVTAGLFYSGRQGGANYSNFGTHAVLVVS